jgi:hypothetical protein
MPRTREQLEKALADTEAWLDRLDPEAIASQDSEAADLRAIGEALRAVAASNLGLAEQVATARANGRTWTQIATVLGVSKQAARERFGQPAHR